MKNVGRDVDDPVWNADVDRSLKIQAVSYTHLDVYKRQVSSGF